MSKRSESEDLQLKSKLPCITCGKTAKTNSYCKNCKETICIVHSTLLNNHSYERICDECLEDHLIVELPDKDTAIEAIRNEIQISMTQRETNTQELHRLSSSLLRKQEDLIKKEEQFIKKDAELSENLKHLKEKTKAIEEDINRKGKEIETGKHDLQFAKNKMQENQKELDGLMEETKVSTRDRNLILAELNELREFIKMHVPIRLIKRIVCKNCYSRAINEYNKVFKPETSTTGTEIRNNSISKIQKKSTGACNSCALF